MGTHSAGGDVLRDLTIILTYQCNLKCRMCGQHNAPSNAKEKKNTTEQLPLDVIKRNIESVPSLRSVYLFGGEPLLYKDFIPLLEFLRTKGLRTIFSTNGIVLKQWSEQIARSGVYMVSVSLDSCEEQRNDAIRGLPGAFRRTLEGVEALLAARARLMAQTPLVKIHFTITPDNYTEMRRYYDYFARRFPAIDRIMFHFPRFLTEAVGKEHEEYMKTHFALPANTWRGFLEKDREFSMIDCQGVYDQVRALRQKPKVFVKGPVTVAQIRDYFQKPEKMLGNDCTFCFRACGIEPNGNVVTCVDFPDVTVGNIHEHTLNQIWDSAQFVHFRDYLREHGRLPVCAKCSRRFKDVYRKSMISVLLGRIGALKKRVLAQLRSTPAEGNPVKKKIGIIGCGSIGMAHLKKIAVEKDMRVSAVSVNTVDSQKKIQELFPVAAYTRFEDMFAQQALDGIIVASPNYLHAEHVRAALSCGYHVLCEKPMALNSRDAQEMVTLAEQKKRVLMMALNLRYLYHTRLAQELCRNGFLGKIYHGKATWLKGRGIPGLGRWFTNRKYSGGGAFIDYGVHLLDVSWLFMGKVQPVAISASAHHLFAGNEDRYHYAQMWSGSGDQKRMDVEDLGCAFIRFADGMSLQIDVAWAANVADVDCQCTIFGEKGGLWWSKNKGLVFYNADAHEVFSYSSNPRKPSPPLIQQCKKTLSTADYVRMKEIIDMRFPTMYRHFVECMEGRECFSPGRDGYVIQYLIDMFYRSSAENREIAIDRNALEVVR